MKQINWGIIGCGDVTEVKSGPAFNKIPGSSLVAVMRRDADKAKDYAHRHQVPAYYTDAASLIHDPQVNAIYVATPPSSHAAYTMAALKAGKPVYVEKPMAMNATEARQMMEVADQLQVKLSVAHYRREQPLFRHIKALLQGGAIGQVRMVQLSLHKRMLTRQDMDTPKTAWRINTTISGGGLFHDLAPHQLDILYSYFGKAKKIQGVALNQAGVYQAPDMVSATMVLADDILFTGNWCFNLATAEERDTCDIIGTTGSISFSFFDQQPVILQKESDRQMFNFDPLPHVQQPMIAAVCRYFRDEATNPCSAAEGVTVMEWMDSITR